MDEAIISYVRKKYNLLIGERTAENLKIQLGTAFETEDNPKLEIRGRNLVDGLPKNVLISSAEVRDAISDVVNNIVDAIKNTLEKTPPELASDIIENGIVLTGGGALLKGLDKLITADTGIAVRVADNPLDCVVEGTLKRIELGMTMDYFDRKRKY